MSEISTHRNTDWHFPLRKDNPKVKVIHQINERPSQWIRTDWHFPLHAARLIVTERQLVILHRTKGLDLHSVLSTNDPELICAVITDFIAEVRPEIAGGQLYQMAFRFPHIWEFIYMHPSFPEWEPGKPPDDMSLIPAETLEQWW